MMEEEGNDEEKYNVQCNSNTHNTATITVPTCLYIRRLWSHKKLIRLRNNIGSCWGLDYVVRSR